MTKYLIILLIVAISCINSNIQAQTTNELKAAYWWPEQKIPEKIVKCKRPVNISEQMLAQSIAGLAARAVNENRSNELVWIETSVSQYDEWYQSFMRNMPVKKSGTKSIWDLVKKYGDSGIIKGFVLYRQGDGSVNPATVYAAMHEAILVDESQQETAINNGLKQMADARNADMKSIFDEKKEELNRNIVVVVSPFSPNNRDLAIAHKCMVYYGVDSTYLSILKWMNPISPIVGWNKGAESEHVQPPSQYGHFCTASDFCLNLSVLSAGSCQLKLSKVKSIDPKTIDYKSQDSYHAFVMSDGDNMQWTMNAFFNEEYYQNKYKKEVPTNWTSCVVNISMMSPPTWEKIVREQGSESSIVEFSGGYQYVDVFANLRPGRWDIFREYARKTNVHMKRTGTKVLNVMTRESTTSDEAREAYRIYAEEIDDLTGIIVIQYSPYHGGNGEIMWVKNKKGIEIPVVTAKYSMWGKITSPGFGRPDQIAQWIDEDTEKGEQTMDWTIVHAWSRYSKLPDGNIVDALNEDRNSDRGVTVIKWCKDLLKSNVKIISIEELLWRIRMKHNPQQTESIINQKR